jgi:hypothetical protein
MLLHGPTTTEGGRVAIVHTFAKRTQKKWKIRMTLLLPIRTNTSPVNATPQGIL